MKNIYAIKNPMCLADTFVFKTHKEIGSFWVQVNCFGKIESLGIDISSRMHGIPLQKIIDNSRPATVREKELLRGFDMDYWYGLKSTRDARKRLGYE